MTFNPRTIALGIVLFLVSAFVTYTLRTVHFPSSPKLLSYPRKTRFHFPGQHQLLTPKVAYATFLAGTPDTVEGSEDERTDSQDGYFLGTRVLVYQLLHSPATKSNTTSIPFLVLCTPDVAARKRARLKRDGATVILVEKLISDWAIAAEPRWRDVLAKLRLFQLTEYSKILFLDADTLVTQPLDGVFYDEATLTQATGTNPAAIREDEGPLPRTYMFAARPDTWGYEHPWPPNSDLTYLNCGFFVCAPSQVLFDYYTSLLRLPGRFDPGFPEQNLLNYAHRREGNMPWKPLWYGWNVNWPTAKDWRGGARSFHAKYWDGDPSHDPVLKAIWKEQRAEMEGYYRGREEAER